VYGRRERLTTKGVTHGTKRRDILRKKKCVIFEGNTWRGTTGARDAEWFSDKKSRKWAVHEQCGRRVRTSINQKN